MKVCHVRWKKASKLERKRDGREKKKDEKEDNGHAWMLPLKKKKTVICSNVIKKKKTNIPYIKPDMNP